MMWLETSDRRNFQQNATSGKKGRSAIGSPLYDLLYVFPRPLSPVLKDCTHAVQVTYILLRKGR